MSRIIPLLLSSSSSIIAAPIAAVSYSPAPTITTVSQDYTPSLTGWSSNSDFILPSNDDLKQVLFSALANVYASLPSSNLIAPFVNEATKAFIAPNFSFIHEYITKATFYDFMPKFQEILAANLKVEATKFTDQFSKLDNSFIKNTDDTMNAFITDQTVLSVNLFEKAKSEKDVTDFIDEIKKSGAFDKNADVSTTIVNVGNKIINDLLPTIANANGVRYQDFISKLKSTFANQDTYNDAIITEIARSMNIDGIKSSITADVQTEIDSESSIISDFGLKKMSDNISVARDAAIKTLDSLTSDLDKLKTVLTNTNSTTQQIKDAVSSFSTSVKGVHDAAVKMVKDAIDNEIKDVQTEWKAITDMAATEIPYTEYRRLNEILSSANPDLSSHEVLGPIFGSNGEAAFKTFISKWNEGKMPNFFKITKTDDPNDLTKVKLEIELSDKFEQNQTISQADKDIYIVNKPFDIVVKMSDVVSLMKIYAVSLADDSNRLADISTLDMDNVGKQIDQSNFEPDLLQFKTTEEVLKLIPSLKSEIESDPILKAKLIDPTTQELNFDISITNVIQQPTSNLNAKVRNYKVDISLSTKDGSDISSISSFDVINIPVFDEKLDDNFASAFKNAIEKSNLLNVKSPIDLILGELWKWQLDELKKTNPAATEADVVKGPGTFKFDSLDKLVNLLGSDPILGVLSRVSDDKDISFIDSLLKLKIPDDYNKNAFNELRSLFYVGNVPDTANMTKVLSALNVSGEIELYMDSTTNVLKARLNTLTVQSRRALLETTTLKNIEIEIHTFNTEVDQATQNFEDMINNYRPLIDQMLDKGQITQSQSDAFWTNVDVILNKFKQDANPATLETLDKLNEIKDEAMKTFEEAVSAFYSNNPTNIKEQLDVAKAAASTAEKDFMNMFQTYVSTASPQLTADEIKAKLDDIKRLFELRAKDLVSKISEDELTDQERQELTNIEARIPAEYKTELEKAFEAEKAKFTIEAAVEFAYGEAAKIDKEDNKLKDIATEKIAEYLATASLSDLNTLLELKSFLKEDMLGQKINLSAPMKYALIALGSFMGLVGALTTFSTLRSLKTNKNISQIGDDASISYQKPKKTMMIKGVISIAALGAAASVITLVLTLGGGL